MHQSLAQQSQTGVPDLVVPHRKIHQRWLVPENSTNLHTAVAGYATVLQAAGKSTVGVAAPDPPVLDTPQYPVQTEKGLCCKPVQLSQALLHPARFREDTDVQEGTLAEALLTAPAFHEAAGHFDPAIHMH